MKISRLTITSNAESDLWQIQMYLVNRAGTDIAESVIEAILSRVETLSTMPGIGRKRDDVMIGVRSITEGNYVIYYEISGDELFITRVISGARDSNAYFE